MAKRLPSAIIVTAAVAFATSSPDATAGSPDGDWFKSLRQNTTGASCCDVADCQITRADWRGQWFAEVQGEMTPIPDDKVLKNKGSPDGEAYVCSGYDRRIYCFVPPWSGF